MGGHTKSYGCYTGHGPRFGRRNFPVISELSLSGHSPPDPGRTPRFSPGPSSSTPASDGLGVVAASELAPGTGRTAGRVMMYLTAEEETRPLRVLATFDGRAWVPRRPGDAGRSARLRSVSGRSLADSECFQQEFSHPAAMPDRSTAASPQKTR